MVKLGIRTAEVVLERFVLTPGQKVVLERSNTCQKVVLEQVFQQCSNVRTETLHGSGFDRALSGAHSFGKISLSSFQNSFDR